MMYVLITLTKFGKPKTVYGPFDTRTEATRWDDDNICATATLIMPLGNP